jgi:protein TonB
MSYADQSMSGNRVTALIIVALIHVVLGYALVTGLAYEAAKKVIQKVTTVDIKEEVKKEEPPPPKKVDIKPPPVVVPPPKIAVNIAPPVIESVPVPPPAPPPIVLAPPPPAPPPAPPKPATPRGNPANWATTNDYPSRALREERSGTTSFRVTVSTDGRVASCQVTSSSGHDDLDQATCANITRRGRFTPAKDSSGNPVQGVWSSRVKWVIPE